MSLNCLTFELSKIDWVAIGAIASAVMILITGYSIISSNHQNEKNRIIQINTIMYQTKIEWINQLKTAINQVLYAIDETIVRDFFHNLRIIQRIKNFRLYILKLKKNSKLLHFRLKLYCWAVPHQLKKNL